MLDMGFIEDINKIIAHVYHQDIQNLLFSATLSTPVRALAKKRNQWSGRDFYRQTDASKANIEQWLVTVDKDRKSALLSHAITTDGEWDQALIFI